MTNTIQKFSICPECDSHNTKVLYTNVLCIIHYCLNCGYQFDVENTENRRNDQNHIMQRYRRFPKE